MSCNPTESCSAPPMFMANPRSPPPPPQRSLEKEFLHHMDMGKEPAPCCDLCYTRLGLTRQSIPSAPNSTVPGSPPRNLYPLPSQLRNKPRVESTTLLLPFPRLLKVLAQLSIRADVAWFRNQCGKYSGKHTRL